MGLEGDDGEVLAGDPIPAAPGQTSANFFDGEGSTAIVGEDGNLWDELVEELDAAQEAANALAAAEAAIAAAIAAEDAAALTAARAAAQALVDAANTPR